MSIELTRAGPADIDQLMPLVSAYHDFEDIESDAAGRAAALGFLLGKQDFGAVFMIREGELVAGYIALCKGFSIEFGGYDAFIDEFYLSPEFRGRGIGKAALEAIVSPARELGIGALHLEVARDNSRAQRLYRDAGFAARDSYLLMTRELAESES